jgi:hypothetical protein
VFITKIFHTIEADPLTQHLSRNAILAAGATNLRQLSTNSDVVEKVQMAYMAGIKDVLILAAVAVCVAHLPLIGMDWVRYPAGTTPLDDGDMEVGSEKSCEASN